EELVTLARVTVPFDPGPQSGRALSGAFQVGWIDLNAVAAMPDLFSHVAAYAAGGLNLTDPERPARLHVAVVTTDFFATLGVAPARGRTFSREEGVPHGPRGAIISHGLCQRQFGGRDFAGLTIDLN